MTYIDNEFDGIPRIPYGGLPQSPVGTGHVPWHIPGQPPGHIPGQPPSHVPWHPPGQSTDYPPSHTPGQPSHTPEGGHGGMPTSPPPAHAVAVAKLLKNNPQLVKLILQNRPQSFSQLMQIVQSFSGATPYGQGATTYGSSGTRYDESDFRPGPCSGDALIIDWWENPYIMDIRTNVGGSFYGWCWELYSGYWYKCSIPHSSIALFLCIP